MQKKIYSPSDLRAEIARRRIPIYRIAGAVGMNPQRLGAMLNGRLPLPDSLAMRIVDVLIGA
jgi:hypothetical protein